MRAVLALALLAVLGCSDREERVQPAFEPIRLVAAPGASRDERFLTWGGTVTIDGVERPVLSAATPITPPVEDVRPEGRQRFSRVVLPVELRAMPWIVVESVVTRDGVTTTMRVWPGPGSQGGTSFDLPVVDEQVGPNGKPGVVLRAAPDLATRDVETAEVTIPQRAVLTAGAALEPASLVPTAIPIDMTVTALEGGREIVLRTVRIEARHPEAKQWRDLLVPLDELAGRAVRFRFSARPMAGPTAVPSLPVWADPKIVDGWRL